VLSPYIKQIRFVFKGLRKTFGLNDEITGGWRRLHTEGRYGLYWSLNNIRVIKSRRMGWMEHVGHMGRREVQVGF
jgi:hypothetical protein